MHTRGVFNSRVQHTYGAYFVLQKSQSSHCNIDLQTFNFVARFVRYFFLSYRNFFGAINLHAHRVCNVTFSSTVLIDISGKWTHSHLSSTIDPKPITVALPGDFGCSWCRRCRRRGSKRSFRRKDRSRHVLLLGICKLTPVKIFFCTRNTSAVPSPSRCSLSTASYKAFRSRANIAPWFAW